MVKFIVQISLDVEWCTQKKYCKSIENCRLFKKGELRADLYIFLFIPSNERGYN